MRKLLIAVGGCVGLFLGTSAHADNLFTDTYSTDTSAQYTATDQSGLVSHWAVGGGTMNFTRSGGQTYATSNLLSNTASTAGLSVFTTSGDLVALGDTGTQQGLIVTGDNTNGGFVVQKWDGGSGHFVLMQQSGTNLHDDEGSVSILDFGAPTTGDTYHISATEDRTGVNPSFDVTITDLTTGTLFGHLTGTDTNVTSDFGGTQIGWRTRANSDSVALSYDNLQLTSAPEPASIGLLGLGAIGLLARRRRMA